MAPLCAPASAVARPPDSRKRCGSRAGAGRRGIRLRKQIAASWRLNSPRHERERLVRRAARPPGRSRSEDGARLRGGVRPHRSPRARPVPGAAGARLARRRASRRRGRRRLSRAGADARPRRRRGRRGRRRRPALPRRPVGDRGAACAVLRRRAPYRRRRPSPRRPVRHRHRAATSAARDRPAPASSPGPTRGRRGRARPGAEAPARETAPAGHGRDHVGRGALAMGRPVQPRLLVGRSVPRARLEPRRVRPKSGWSDRFLSPRRPRDADRADRSRDPSAAGL